MEVLIYELLNNKVIQYSKSPFATSIGLIKKKRWKLVNVYRLQGTKQSHH